MMNFTFFSNAIKGISGLSSLFTFSTTKKEMILTALPKATAPNMGIPVSFYDVEQNPLKKESRDVVLPSKIDDLQIIDSTKTSQIKELQSDDAFASNYDQNPSQSEKNVDSKIEGLQLDTTTSSCDKNPADSTENISALPNNIDDLKITNSKDSSSVNPEGLSLSDYLKAIGVPEIIRPGLTLLDNENSVESYNSVRSTIIADSVGGTKDPNNSVKPRSTIEALNPASVKQVYHM